MTEFSDQRLMEETAALVKTERQTTARILDYLSEIDRRRLWAREGYSSLHDFCVRYLNYSESEANRRIQSAHCVERVAEVKPLLEQNKLSLTGLSLIAPWVTAENAATLIPKVEGKSTRQIEKVLHEDFPESRPAQEILKVILDDELKALLQQAQDELSEKDQTILLKRVLKRFLAKGAPRATKPKTHTRYVPSEIKRRVKVNGAGCCEFVSKSGVRCNQTAHLEIDHVRPWAKGGSSWDPTNLRVLCRLHNRQLGREAFPSASLSREIVSPMCVRASCYSVG